MANNDIQFNLAKGCLCIGMYLRLPHQLNTFEILRDDAVLSDGKSRRIFQRTSLAKQSSVFRRLCVLILMFVVDSLTCSNRTNG